uniref:Retinoic acid receptor responder protein 2 n=1 Tax=Xiphophorus maculatus TaxID=8083 RepID=M3ZI47_XIPMA
MIELVSFSGKKRAGCPSSPLFWNMGRLLHFQPHRHKLTTMVAFLLWVFSLGCLALPSDTQPAYNDLPESFKKGVDLTLERLSSHASILHHFRFFRSLEKSEIEPGFDVKIINHNFYLKATKCPKGTVDASSCQFRNDRPLIDCVTCYKTFEGEIEAEPQPYIHCVHRSALTEDMRTTRAEQWEALKYKCGTPTLLSSVGDN